VHAEKDGSGTGWEERKKDPLGESVQDNIKKGNKKTVRTPREVITTLWENTNAIASFTRRMNEGPEVFLLEHDGGKS